MSFTFPILVAALALAAPRTQIPGALRVVGNELRDERGAPVRLRGVNHSGAEYACLRGSRIFDSPATDDVARAIASWGATIVRLPLNESCWLGARGVPARTSGSNYRAAILTFVRVLRSHGLYVMLELHWSAPGEGRAEGQQPMPDGDRSPAFWRSVATVFRGEPGVLFDLFNEPFPESVARDEPDAWRCWRDGCTILRSWHRDTPWRAAGMQSLVDAVRSTGARQPIVLGGLSWAHDVSAWQAFAPRDPLGALVASFHTYRGQLCDDEGCWNSHVATLAARVPVIATEVGDDSGARGFLDRWATWANAHGVSYLAWTWNVWRGSPFRLVADWSGRPASAFASALRTWFRRTASP